MVTDVEGVRAAVEACGAGNVLCVVTTTSCFAPRLPDKARLYNSRKNMLCAATENRVCFSRNDQVSENAAAELS